MERQHSAPRTTARKYSPSSHRFQSLTNFPTVTKNICDRSDIPLPTPCVSLTSSVTGQSSPNDRSPKQSLFRPTPAGTLRNAQLQPHYVEEHQIRDQSPCMELLLLQFHWTLVHLRVLGLWTEGLPIMQPEDPIIKCKWRGGLEVLMNTRKTRCNRILMVTIPV